MVRLAVLVVVFGGCIVVPSQGAPPPSDPSAQPPQEQQPPPPRRVIYRHRHAPTPVANNDDDDDDQTPRAHDDQTASSAHDDEAPSPTHDEQTPHHGHHEDHDADDSYNWPPAGSEDPFGIGKDWKQYTTAEIQRLPRYEPGRAYKNGTLVQEPWSIPRTHVYRCSQPAGCTSREPSANAAGWDNVGWYDERAPRYGRRMPLPPLKPGENPFPDDGKPLGDDEVSAVPEYNNGTTYSFGALVKVGYVTVPHEVVYKCKSKSCDRSPTGNGWTAYGWHGREF
jgi:hypothetical protein